MRKILLIAFVLCFALLSAVGREDPEPAPEPQPEPQPVEAAPEPAPEPVVVPEPEPGPVLVEAPEPAPRHQYSLAFNGINRYEAPTIARINIGPQTAENHAVKLDAWFEIQVGENEWYSVMELVELIR